MMEDILNGFDKKKVDEMRESIARLPQAKYLTKNNISKWIATVLTQDPERAMWHVERLSGIGGSEIGVLVANRRRVQDAFGGTARNLLLEKLMVFRPRKQTLAMRKGIIIESGIRTIFLEDFKATRDEAAMNLMGSSNRYRPWMRYSPDDVVNIEGKKYLVDYKHPHEASLHNEIHLRYKSQLHMGVMVAQQNKIGIDGMLLVQYPESGGDSLQVTPVEFDEDLARDIIESGDEAWAMLLDGTNYPEDQMVAYTDELKPDEIDELNGLAARYVSNKVAVDQITALMSESKTKIEDIFGRHVFNGKCVVPSYGVHVSVSEPVINYEVLAQAIGDNSPYVESYDSDAMLKYLIDNNVDVSQFETGKKILDENALLSMAEKEGLDIRSFMSNPKRLLLKVDDAYRSSVGHLVANLSQAVPPPSFAEIKKTKPFTRKTSA